MSSREDGFLRNSIDGAVCVGIVMGSWSDWSTMKPAFDILTELQVATEAGVISAHRTPHLLGEYAARAQSSRFAAVIAGAGGAAHLPGMIAAYLPGAAVIGVPVKTSTLSGVDSLYSIIQMPPEVPVGAVAIGGGLNAGLLAAQIAAVGDPWLAQRLIDRRALLAKMVEENPDPRDDPRTK
ncbi:MAG: 5-(carboxyamino)imidazole ribonucleotide mutase [Patescibacteria group bacterium]|jgi:5-(carboxyamino)imidazole ribonucleotide mutase|nr:5-(carboxyamino)imidazole ribonucleotide mutase [Patescibacteria group bacterium]